MSHPFHIHVNDYQIKQSDNELPNKLTLEDVTSSILLDTSMLMVMECFMRRNLW